MRQSFAIGLRAYDSVIRFIFDGTQRLRRMIRKMLNLDPFLRKTCARTNQRILALASVDDSLQWKGCAVAV
jgi:hypothetical protein